MRGKRGNANKLHACTCRPTVSGVSSTPTWSTYVGSLGSRALIAQAGKVDVATVSRWISGSTRAPRADNVIRIARRLGHNPLGALVAAGYLEQSEIDEIAGSTPRMFALSNYTDLELAREAVRRIEQGSSTDLLQQPLDEGHPAMDNVSTMQPRTVGDLSDDDLERLPTAAGRDETQPDEE